MAKPFEPIEERRRRFCEEYLIDLNGTQAAIRAGYSPKSARTTASRLLADENISRVLAELRDQQSKRLEINADYVLNGLVENNERALQRIRPKMVFNPVTKSFDQAEDDDGNKIFEYDGMVSNRSLELLGKHLGLFVERKEHSGPNGGPININNGLDLSKLSIEELEELERLSKKASDAES